MNTKMSSFQLGSGTIGWPSGPIRYHNTGQPLPWRHRKALLPRRGPAAIFARSKSSVSPKAAKPARSHRPAKSNRTSNQTKSKLKEKLKEVDWPKPGDIDSAKAWEGVLAGAVAGTVLSVGISNVKATLVAGVIAAAVAVIPKEDASVPTDDGFGLPGIALTTAAVEGQKGLQGGAEIRGSQAATAAAASVGAGVLVALLATKSLPLLLCGAAGWIAVNKDDAFDLEDSVVKSRDYLRTKKGSGPGVVTALLLLQARQTVLTLSDTVLSNSNKMTMPSGGFDKVSAAIEQLGKSALDRINKFKWPPQKVVTFTDTPREPEKPGELLEAALKERQTLLEQLQLEEESESEGEKSDEETQFEDALKARQMQPGRMQPVISDGGQSPEAEGEGLADEESDEEIQFEEALRARQSHPGRQQLTATMSFSDEEEEEPAEEKGILKQSLAPPPSVGTKTPLENLKGQNKSAANQTNGKADSRPLSIKKSVLESSNAAPSEGATPLEKIKGQNKDLKAEDLANKAETSPQPNEVSVLVSGKAAPAEGSSPLEILKGQNQGAKAADLVNGKANFKPRSEPESALESSTATFSGGASPLEKLKGQNEGAKAANLVNGKTEFKPLSKKDSDLESSKNAPSEGATPLEKLKGGNEDAKAEDLVNGEVDFTPNKESVLESSKAAPSEGATPLEKVKGGNEDAKAEDLVDGKVDFTPNKESVLESSKAAPSEGATPLEKVKGGNEDAKAEDLVDGKVDFTPNQESVLESSKAAPSEGATPLEKVKGGSQGVKAEDLANGKVEFTPLPKKDSVLESSKAASSGGVSPLEKLKGANTSAKAENLANGKAEFKPLPTKESVLESSKASFSKGASPLENLKGPNSGVKATIPTNGKAEAKFVSAQKPVLSSSSSSATKATGEGTPLEELKGKSPSAARSLSGGTSSKAAPRPASKPANPQPPVFAAASLSARPRAPAKPISAAASAGNGNPLDEALLMKQQLFYPSTNSIRPFSMPAVEQQKLTEAGPGATEGEPPSDEALRLKQQLFYFKTRPLQISPQPDGQNGNAAAIRQERDDEGRLAEALALKQQLFAPAPARVRPFSVPAVQGSNGLTARAAASGADGSLTEALKLKQQLFYPAAAKALGATPPGALKGNQQSARQGSGVEAGGRVQNGVSATPSLGITQSRKEAGPQQSSVLQMQAIAGAGKVLQLLTVSARAAGAAVAAPFQPGKSAIEQQTPQQRPLAARPRTAQAPPSSPIPRGASTPLATRPTNHRPPYPNLSAGLAGAGASRVAPYAGKARTVEQPRITPQQSPAASAIAGGGAPQPKRTAVEKWLIAAGTGVVAGLLGLLSQLVGGAAITEPVPSLMLACVFACMVAVLLLVTFGQRGRKPVPAAAGAGN